MKNKTKARDRATTRPTKTAYTALRQIVQWIPEGLPDRIAREAKADIRTFSCTSHVLALLYGQIVRSGSLNEICDAARLHEPELNRIWGATAPQRNTAGRRPSNDRSGSGCWRTCCCSSSSTSRSGA